jgi:prepilin-type N-terminal cleavage/methylation domain-containing protein
MARTLLEPGQDWLREGAVDAREKGFSLVELMIAMVVTLIITGAVFQLVSAGNTAFRKEPALADRQQNIRMALDLISQDVFQAGYGLPTMGQAFTDELNGVGPGGSGGENTDELELFRATECPTLTVCPLNSEPTKSVQTVEKFSECYSFPAVVLMGNDSEWDLRWAKEPGAGESAKKCNDDESGSKHGHAVFPPGKSPLNPSGGFTDFDNPPTYMMLGQAIRYRINVDADGTPNLERSAAGGQDDPDGNSTWQIIARGVEDLQVEYENATGWHDTPGTIDCSGPTGCTAPTQADYDRLIRRVRVRLSARVMEGGQFAGESTSAVGSALRGQLRTEVAPRAAMATLGSFKGEL